MHGYGKVAQQSSLLIDSTLPISTCLSTHNQDQPKDVLKTQSMPGTPAT